VARSDSPRKKATRARGPAARTRKTAARSATAARETKPAARRSAAPARPSDLANLSDKGLIEAIQRQTFRYFWEGGHAVSGLALDRRTAVDKADDRVTVGGSGFGVMALIVAVKRGWITREAAVERLGRMLSVLTRARCYHGAFPHFMNGTTGATLPFGHKDDGGDLVETSLLIMGLLCAREFFGRKTPAENAIRGNINYLWFDVEWDWYTQGGRDVLYWHWSPNNGWALDHEIRGWNECLITYVLAASSPRYAIDPVVYHRGFAAGRGFLNGKSYYDVELPLGMAYGGPLFFTHYTFCGLDPRGLKDRYADYWHLNQRHVRINRAHCVANPKKFAGYGEQCWGLTASDDPTGYMAHAPDNDNGTISPTAALASVPYAPREALQVARHLLQRYGEKVWGPYGFVDAFCESQNWYADTYLAIDQGPIIVMMENHRTGLLWKLFMSVPEVRAGLGRLGFKSPHLTGR
jgi:hypothetical protein